MASSIYVYENMKEFENWYKGFTDEPFKHLKIVDMFVHKKDRLWVVTNTNQEKERPLLQKSLVHFRNGNIDEYKTDETKLILHDKVKFNFKKGKLEIFPRFLRKPLLTWKVDRYFGEKPKEKLINWYHRYYDFELDRINLILKD